VTNMFGAAITAWLNGQKSFGEAMKEELQQYLANLAGKAAANALFYTAQGIADAFWNPGRAGADFAAAAEFAALAGVAGGVAAGMGHSGGSGSGGSGAGSRGNTAIPQNAATQAGGPVTASVN